MIALTADQVEQLARPVPNHVVMERKQGFGERAVMVSYVDRQYVYETMSRIFGHGGWGYRILALEQASEWQDDKGRSRIAYQAQIELQVNGAVAFQEVGHGHGIDKDKGQAVESAAKEAVTDAVKRACAALGECLGGSLYRKRGERSAEPPPKIPAGLEFAANAFHPTGAMMHGIDAMQWAKRFRADINAAPKQAKAILARWLDAAATKQGIDPADVFRAIKGEEKEETA
jgi:hypothetical protein